MRNTTQIKEIAEKLKDQIDTEFDFGVGRDFGEELLFGLTEIINIATEMDARTGTIDPSLKKE